MQKGRLVHFTGRDARRRDAFCLEPRRLGFDRPEADAAQTRRRCAIVAADTTKDARPDARFNCPYQASASDEAPADADLGACGADTIAAHVRSGDLVIAATDGYWDNVFDSTTLATVALQDYPRSGRRRLIKTPLVGYQNASSA